MEIDRRMFLGAGLLAAAGVVNAAKGAGEASLVKTGGRVKKFIAACPPSSSEYGRPQYSVAEGETKFLGFTHEGSPTLATAAVLAPKAGDGETATADNAPKPDEVPADNETDAAKIARIGTSSYAARADHIHPICKDIGTAQDPGEITLPVVRFLYPENDITLDSTEWTAGGDAGIIIPQCVGVKQYNDDTNNDALYRFLIFRNFTYSKNGNLLKCGREYIGCRFRV